MYFFSLPNLTYALPLLMLFSLHFKKRFYTVFNYVNFILPSMHQIKLSFVNIYQINCMCIYKSKKHKNGICILLYITWEVVRGHLQYSRNLKVASFKDHYKLVILTTLWQWFCVPTK